jgi:predicted dinucleotide-binding enzyme
VIIGILGSGGVARTLAPAWAHVGHDVMLGTRNPTDELHQWAAARHISLGSYADVAEHSVVVVNATQGQGSVAAIRSAGPDALAGTVLLDVANPLDFSAGFPPTLLDLGGVSLAERIQQEAPDARVVKALNTVTAAVMVQPDMLPEPHTLFLCGDDDSAKATVEGLLTQLGWPSSWLLDLGDLSNARGTEAWLLLWTRLYQRLGDARFNVRVVRNADAEPTQ